jgi:putative polymerase
MAVAHAAYAQDRGAVTDFLAGGLLVSAVLFNAALAIINAKVMPLNTSIVIACEVLIVAAAHVLALTQLRTQMLPWYALIFFLMAFALFRWAALGSPEVKYLRDVLLIPTFIILGMTFSRERLPSVLVLLQLIVLGVMLLELLSLDTYADLFDIKSYYINTRGYTEEDFWNTASTLFVSASRPDDRFFTFVDYHRMSSVFLEPVSLGDYCIIMFSFALAFWRNLTALQRIVLLGGSILLIVGCDSRLATVSCLIIAAASLIAPRMPPRIVVFLPGAVLIAAFAAVTYLGLKPGADNFSGRLAHTVDLLRTYGAAEFLGISETYMSKAVDSGLAYLISTQSVLGVLVIWLFIALYTDEWTKEAVIFKTAIALYLSLSMLVSFAFLTIKTAAIVWFMMGALQSAPARLPSRSRTGRTWRPQRAR